MLNPRSLGFPAENKITAPHHRSPFPKKAAAVADQSPAQAMDGESMRATADPTSTPAMASSGSMGVAGNPGGHPANPHLANAIKATDHASKQKHVFKALSAIRKAAVTK